MSEPTQTAVEAAMLTDEEYDDLWTYVADKIHTALYNARLDIVHALREPLNDADRKALAPITDDISALEEKYLYRSETRLERVKRAVAVLMGRE